MSTTLITGGAGYIGSRLAHDLLRAGRRVRVLDCLRSGGEAMLGLWGDHSFEFVHGDIRDPAIRRRALTDVDTVVHLAAIVGDPACKLEPALANEVNLDATRGLVTDAAATGVQRLVFVSTCSNYGITDPTQLATEASPLNPLSVYAQTKVEAERSVLEPRAPMLTTVLRLATVYGVSPRMRFDLTINEFARDAALGKKLVVYAERDWRPYVHVRDVSRAIQLVLQSPAANCSGQVFNVGCTEENYQKQTITNLLRKRVPALEVEFVKSGPDLRSYRVSFERIAGALGFQPSYRVPDGLDEICTLVENRVIANLADAQWVNV